MIADMDKFFQDFPNGHVVHAIRNPWSCFADYLKRPYPGSLTQYCQTWNSIQHFAYIYALKYPHNFHIVRVEDAMASKAETMSWLLERLNLPWDDAVLYPSFNGRKLESVYPWGTIVTPTTEVNRQTALELSQEQLKAVKTECTLMVKTFGYDSFYANLFQ
jgi:hypothetical protein